MLGGYGGAGKKLAISSCVRTQQIDLGQKNGGIYKKRGESWYGETKFVVPLHCLKERNSN